MAFFNLLVFPGIIFLVLAGLGAEFIDRKVYARLQNRMGPPWFQPIADLIKLFSKEEIIPCEANVRMFRLMPLLSLASVITAFLYIPIWGTKALYSFRGDVIIVLYLLTIPTMAFFIGGWYSTSLYARIGAVRAVTQLFAYEVPLFMGILAAALLADSWSLSQISAFYNNHPGLAFANLIGFGVSIVAILGKLEKTPFDIPEAETEIVSGCLVEYSGRLLALFRLAIDVELVVCCALLAAVFLPFGMGSSPLTAFLLFLVKVISLVCLLSLIRTILARIRIDQLIVFCWKYLAPAALIQLLLNLLIKKVIL